ncbi:MAG: T9SS type A sorting domain-containing protein [Ignavibacteria bacterium]|nr:T9SS type A sorting domain-containing protein [Ignavibacteria bacterium]
MKKYISIFIFLLIFKLAFSQSYCIPGRFDTNYAFGINEIDTIGEIIYGQNVNWLGQNVMLDAIIAHPNFSLDSLNKRPFLLLLHGGGFYSGDKYILKPIIMDFAMKGYVTASISYRLGWNTGGNPFDCNGDGYSLVKAIYRALQDTKAAFRFFCANANQFRIDTSYMFVGGISAGAVISLLLPFITQNDINSLYPNLVNELGYLDSATNTYKINFRVKSVISSSGAILDTSYITYSKAIPILMFHGTADINVPYGTGYAYSCPNYILTQGSYEIMKRMRNIKFPFELNYVPGGGHENFYPIEYLLKRTTKFLRRTLCNEGRQIIIENYTVLLDTNLGYIPKVKNNFLIIKNYVLYQNYPNPFNNSTVIRYSLPEQTKVSLDLYDITGRKVRTLIDEYQRSGLYSINFEASNLCSGIYIYKLTTENFNDAKLMILVK